jgi:hypothetical protein
LGGTYGWSMRALGVSWHGTMFVCAVVLLCMSPACAATDMDDKLSGEPCTRTDQCARGLVCSGGACTHRGNATENSGDAGAVGDDAGETALGK